MKDIGKRKIVYWGTGKICSECLMAHKEVEPAFFIDSNKEGTFDGKPILKPDCIENWHELFVIITIKSFDVVKTQLERFGLSEGTDFESYKAYFKIEYYDIPTSVQRLSDLPVSWEGYSLLFQDFELYSNRKNTERISFFRRLSEKAGKDDFLVIAPAGVMNEEDTSRSYGFLFRQIPVFSLDKNSFNELDMGLSSDDERFIKEVENFKDYPDSFERRMANRNRYYWYKKVFSTISVKQVFYWGCWFEAYYFLRHLAYLNTAGFYVMEYGWLPGTFCIDPLGSAGESFLMSRPELIQNHALVDREKIVKIKNYIKKSKLDSWTFKVFDEDDKKLTKLDERPRILFIGMGEKGIAVVNGSEKWRRSVSSSVNSTKEAVNILSDICDRNDWNLIIKPHPEVSTFGEEIEKEHNNIVFIKEKRIDDLLEISDVVVSIVSSVEVKALIYGKPVVQLGHSPLQHTGATYYAGSGTEIEDLLKKALKQGFTEAQEMKFDSYLEFMLENYWYDDMQPREVRYGKHEN